MKWLSISILPQGFPASFGSTAFIRQLPQERIPSARLRYHAPAGSPPSAAPAAGRQLNTASRRGTCRPCPAAPLPASCSIVSTRPGDGYSPRPSTPTTARLFCGRAFLAARPKAIGSQAARSVFSGPVSPSGAFLRTRAVYLFAHVAVYAFHSSCCSGARPYTTGIQLLHLPP